MKAMTTKLEWTVSRLMHVALFSTEHGNGRVEFRAIHDPIYMQWLMIGRIYGFDGNPIKLNQMMPDQGLDSSNLIVDIFRDTCEQYVNVYLAGAGAGKLLAQQQWF